MSACIHILYVMYIVYYTYIPISYLMQQCVCNCSDNEQLFFTFSPSVLFSIFSLPGASVDLCLFFSFFLCFFSACFSVCIRFAVTVCVCVFVMQKGLKALFSICVRGSRSSKLVYKGLALLPQTAMPSAPSATPLSPFWFSSLCWRVFWAHKLKMHFKAAVGGTKKAAG